VIPANEHEGGEPIINKYGSLLSEYLKTVVYTYGTASL